VKVFGPCLAALFLLLLPACALRTEGSWNPDGHGQGDVDVRDADIDGPRPDAPDGEGIPPNCGDGRVDEGEQCDDGNGTEGDGCDGDCTYSCQVDGACLDGDPCNGDETCDVPTHTCRPGTPRGDGFVCSNEPRMICLGGSCAASVCGDGFVDEGAGEFCDPPGGVCLEGCTLGCETPADCPGDANACNGDEVCDPSRHTCGRTDPLGDGTPCGDGPSRMICIGSMCQESICGDGFVDPGASPPEECDDANGNGGDGCENDCTFSCHADSDCQDPNACNGQERCDVSSTHTCLPGSPAPSGTGCDDGVFCTRVDTCDGFGSCLGAGDTCADERSCTTNETCDEAGRTCAFDMVAGTCLIGGSCHGDGDVSPTDECLECRSTTDAYGWSTRPDASPCTGGLCCAGTCVGGAECCHDGDCPPARCDGTPAACSTFGSETGCSGQGGCSWATQGVCGGSLSCNDLDGWFGSPCLGCGCGCSWSFGYCYCGGTGSRCNTFTDRGSCEDCGCGWTVTSAWCQGTPTACSGIADAAACTNQQGCGWIPQTCTANQCP
jgi:cysteine-rich repeat protein